jgi:hypothetical protein
VAVAADPGGLVLALGLGLELADEQHQREQAAQLAALAVARLGRPLLRLNRVIERLDVALHTISVPAARAG